MNIKQIAQLVVVGHDFSQYRVKAVHKDELTLLSYTNESQWANEWTEIEQLCRGLVESEGFVLRYRSGERFKIKGDDYVFLHRIISNVSKKNVFEMWRNNESMPDIPDEFIVQIENWYDEFNIVKQDIYEECLSVFSIAPKETKRDFALAVKSHKYSSILFAMWDDNTQLIAKTLLDAVKRECEI